MLGHVLLRGLLFQAVGVEEGAGGGTAAAGVVTPPAAQAAATAAPPVDRKAIEAEVRAAARSEFLREQGFKDEADFDADKVERKKAADAKLSNEERTSKALKESLDERGKIEARAERYKAENEALKAQIATRATLDKAQVRPGDHRVAEVLLSDARAAAGKDFDEATFFEDLRKERPYLFGAASAAGDPLATTSPRLPAAPASNGQPSSLIFDAASLPDTDWAKWKAANGLS